MLPGWAAVYLLPALADLARMRCGVRLLERPPLGILCGWVGAYTPVPALLAGIAAALLCAWQAARRPGRKPEVAAAGLMPSVCALRRIHPPYRGGFMGNCRMGRLPCKGSWRRSRLRGALPVRGGDTCKVWQHLALHP